MAKVSVIIPASNEIYLQQTITELLTKIGGDVEVACKTWLSGGRIMINRTTWYAHMFRTQGGDFGFPYENPQSKVVENRKLSRELFEENKWNKAIHDFNWLLDKFNPPEWR